MGPTESPGAPLGDFVPPPSLPNPAMNRPRRDRRQRLLIHIGALWPCTPDRCAAWSRPWCPWRCSATWSRLRRAARGHTPAPAPSPPAARKVTLRPTVQPAPATAGDAGPYAFAQRPVRGRCATATVAAIGALATPEAVAPAALARVELFPTDADYLNNPVPCLPAVEQNGEQAAGWCGCADRSPTARRKGGNPALQRLRAAEAQVRLATVRRSGATPGKRWRARGGSTSPPILFWSKQFSGIEIRSRQCGRRVTSVTRGGAGVVCMSLASWMVIHPRAWTSSGSNALQRRRPASGTAPTCRGAGKPGPPNNPFRQLAVEGRQAAAHVRWRRDSTRPELHGPRT